MSRGVSAESANAHIHHDPTRFIPNAPSILAGVVPRDRGIHYCERGSVPDAVIENGATVVPGVATEGTVDDGQRRVADLVAIIVNCSSVSEDPIA